MFLLPLSQRLSEVKYCYSFVTGDEPWPKEIRSGHHRIATLQQLPQLLLGLIRQIKSIIFVLSKLSKLYDIHSLVVLSKEGFVAYYVLAFEFLSMAHTRYQHLSSCYKTLKLIQVS
jgi:hypothetical protein